ncbi:MAG TPA: M23 family metallopeptidase [Polyangia bacterium]|nr:M23 family metallopeptidase [Polyangia bacterium]
MRRAWIALALAGATASGRSAADPGRSRDRRLTLRDGTVVEGELIHTYDHSQWILHPGGEETYAIFDGSRLASAYAADRSLTFVPRSQVRQREPCRERATAASYHEILRARGILFERLPLDGVWYVAQAGESFHLREDGYGDFAWDLLRVDARGMQHRSDGTRNQDYYAWGEPVVLPASGTVASVVRDQPDGDPRRNVYGAGNAVYVRLYGRYLMAFLHLKEGSIPDSVRPGARLEVGTRIGQVGNSGTRYPHLHLALLFADHPDSGRSWGVPVEFARLYVKRPADRGASARRFAVPERATLVSSEPFEWVGAHPEGGWDALHEPLDCRK